MAPTFDWTRIDSGDALAELVGCLLLQEVSKHVRVFGKPGRDFGIDAAFEGAHDGVTGKWRYQSKCYASLSDLKAKLKGGKGNRPKGEVALVVERLDKGPGDRGGRLWHGCTHYVLLTNVDMSPQEVADVKDVLKPIADRGIEVHVWHGAKLQKLCEGQPLVMQQYFGTDRPAFIPLAEFVRLEELRPGGDRLRSLPCVGREEALGSFKGFLSYPARVLLVPGTGGVGKTRALLEFAGSIDDDPSYDVRFLQNESEAIEPHLASLRAGRQLVLFVDDADAVPPEQLRRVLALAAQGVPLGGMPKLVMAVRSASAPVVQTAARKAVGVKHVAESELRPVSADLRAVVDALGVSEVAAGPLLKLAGGIPIWLSLGADALAAGANPATLTRDGVIRFKLEQYLSPLAERELHEKLLHTLAVIEPVNLRDGETRTTIARLLGADEPTTARALDEIRRARFVAQYGRYIKLAPDLLADYLLQRALITPTGIPTNFQQQLLQADVPDRRRLINNLARAEYLLGEPLLAEIMRSARAAIPTADNAERVAIFESLGGAAVVRPGDFLVMSRAVLEDPSPGSAPSRNPRYASVPAFAPKYSHDDVLFLVVATLEGPLQWPEHRREALELAAEIAETEGAAATKARSLFQKATTWGQDGVDLEEQRVALDLLEEWTAPARPTKHLGSVVDGLKRILAMEATSWESDDDAFSLSFTKARLQLNDELRRVRERALDMVFRLAKSPEPATRREAAKVVQECIGETVRAMAPEDRSAVVPSNDDPMKPVVVPYKVPQVNSVDALNAQISELFARVETEAAQERDPTVLVEWEACVDWHARFEPETDLGKQASRLIATMRDRADYRLACALLGKARDPRDDAEIDAAVLEVLKTHSPEQLFGILQATVRSSGDGSMGHFLFRLAERAPSYSRSLLDLCGGKTDEPALPSYPLGMLLSGLHVRGTDRALVRQRAAWGGAWRRVAAAAVSRLRPEWYEGFTLTTDDLALIRELALDPERNVWKPVADLARSLARHAPDACLALARELSVGHGDEGIEDVAEMCRELLDRDAATHQAGVAALVQGTFVSAPRLDGYWTARLLVRLSAGNLDWLVDFFDARIRTAETLDAPLHEFHTVPEVIDQMLPAVARVSDQNADAVARVLGWALSSGRRAYEGAILLRKLVGKRVTPVLVEALERVVSASASPADLARPACAMLRAFLDGDDKMSALFVLLDAIDRAGSSGRVDAIRALVDSIGGGPISAAMGRPPPTLVSLLTLLRQFAATHPGHATVHTFVQVAVQNVEARLVWHREQGEEFRIRAS